MNLADLLTESPIDWNRVIALGGDLDAIAREAATHGDDVLARRARAAMARRSPRSRRRGGARAGAGRPAAGSSARTSVRWTGLLLAALDHCRIGDESRSAALKRLCFEHPDFQLAMHAVLAEPRAAGLREAAESVCDGCST